MPTKPLIIKTLSNGLRVAIVSDRQATTVTASVLVGVGSAFETQKENGLSHFLEHMAFKGTTRRPTPKILLEEIESLGAVSNAFTSQEYTGYWVKGNPRHLDKFIDILADIYQESTLPENEIQKEKGVIIEEINMYEDMTPYKASDVIFEMLYGKHALARSILGTKETVASFSREDFLSYKKRYYNASNTVVVLAGDVVLSKAMAMIKKGFGELSKSKKNRRSSVSVLQKAPLTKIFSKTSDQAHFILAFRSIKFGHKDAAAVRILATILGRGMSSRLALIIRDELGAAYYVSAQQNSFVDQGVFFISAGIDKTRLEEVISRIIIECNRLKQEKVEDKELAKAKEFSIGNIRLGLELSDDVASFYGTQMVLEQTIKTPEQVIGEIRKVTARDVMRVAKIIFQAQKANLAVVGPFKNSDIPKNLLKKLS